MVKNVIGYKGDVQWDTFKPDGAPRKILNVDRLHSIEWRHKASLKEGIKKTYKYYLESL